MEKIIIEVTHPKDQKREYRSFKPGKIRIGRGLMNDLILSDPYVSEEHLLVQADADGWTLTDMDSENGVALNHEMLETKEAVFKSGDEIVIGRTRLKILSSTHKLPPTRILSKSSKVFRRISKHRVSWGLFFIVIGLANIEAYVFSTEKVKIENNIILSVVLMLAVLFWASIMSFVGRLIRHKMNFPAQLAITSLSLLTMFFSSYVVDFIGYYLSSYDTHNVLRTIVLFVIFSIFFVWNIAIATDISRKVQRLSISIISVIIVLLTAMGQISKNNEFDSGAYYADILLPPFIKIKPSQPVERFILEGDYIFDISIKD